MSNPDSRTESVSLVEIGRQPGVFQLSRWLTWTPGKQISPISADPEPTKPTKLGSEGFEGPVLGHSSKVRPGRVRQSQETTPVLVKAATECPPLPPGVRLMSYRPKQPPVAVTVCSVVTDVPKFIEHCLAELSARLHSPVQIRAGDSVFELLSKLADCGLELVVEWAPQHKPDEVSHDDGEQSPDGPSKG